MSNVLQFVKYSRGVAPGADVAGSATLPRAQTRATETDSSARGDKVTAATSSTSLYDNVGSGGKTQQRGADVVRQTRDRGTQQQTQDLAPTSGITTTAPGKMSICTQNHVASQVGQEPHEASKSEGTQAGGTLQGSKKK